MWCKSNNDVFFSFFSRWQTLRMSGLCVSLGFCMCNVYKHIHGHMLCQYVWACLNKWVPLNKVIKRYCTLTSAFPSFPFNNNVHFTTFWEHWTAATTTQPSLVIPPSRLFPKTGFTFFNMQQENMKWTITTAGLWGKFKKLLNTVLKKLNSSSTHN